MSQAPRDWGKPYLLESNQLSLSVRVTPISNHSSQESNLKSLPCRFPRLSSIALIGSWSYDPLPESPSFPRRCDILPIGQKLRNFSLKFRALGAVKLFVRGMIPGNQKEIRMSSIMTLTIGLGIAVLKLWFMGSLFTSSIKAVSDSCGKSYGVESVGVNGDWFCAEGDR